MSKDVVGSKTEELGALPFAISANAHDFNWKRLVMIGIMEMRIKHKESFSSLAIFMKKR